MNKGKVTNAFNNAQWCSLDPVCTEQEGQGPGWLNRAACHACSLIPEPSCDYYNVFLLINESNLYWRYIF